MLRRLLALLCAFTVMAPAAAAQEDGVFVDPGSPSGKEYVLPIDRARAEAAGSKKTQKGPDSEKAPLFGEGVDGKDRGSARGSSARVQAAGGGDERSSDDPASSADPASNAAAGQLSLPAQAGTADGGLGLGASIGAGVGFLLIGGGAGLWLRRRAAS